jgi:hypothetical protein
MVMPHHPLSHTHTHTHTHTKVIGRIPLYEGLGSRRDLYCKNTTFTTDW